MLFFTSYHDGHGQELWKSDGTAARTMMVKDIIPGVGSSSPKSLVNVNGILFFTAGEENRPKLWKSDGTAGGTRLVKDINPDSDYGTPHNLTNVDGTLFFRADDGLHGYELWKSDGTEEGTVMVKDINPGSDSSSMDSLTEVNDTLFSVQMTAFTAMSYGGATAQKKVQ